MEVGDKGFSSGRFTPVNNDAEGYPTMCKVHEDYYTRLMLTVWRVAIGVVEERLSPDRVIRSIETTAEASTMSQDP